VTTHKGSLREVERQRCERLLITVPIRVEGVDRNGERFYEQTRTLVINREGARIYLKRKVTPAALLNISTSIGPRTAKFRVVGPTQPASSEGSEWGVECVEPNCNIWGIGFPPPASKEGQCVVLVECRRCHAVSLSQLSLVEHEVLGTSGLLVKPCGDCGRLTSWSYKDPSLAAAAEGQGSPEILSKGPAGSGRRAHGRVALQLPIRVRSFYGTEEFARSENVSRGGLCFVTDRTYEVGEILLLTCPYETSGHNIEVRSHVIRRQEMQGTGRKIYGVGYER
jgi:hypothetical protein